MRMLNGLGRPAPARGKRRPTPSDPPPRPSADSAYERLRRIADLDNEATRHIDEAQALLALTLDECPAIYIDEAVFRLKTARDILEPIVKETHKPGD